MCPNALPQSKTGRVRCVGQIDGGAFGVAFFSRLRARRDKANITIESLGLDNRISTTPLSMASLTTLAVTLRYLLERS